MGPILRIVENDKAPTIQRPPNRSNIDATFVVLQERDDFCGVRVVPIGKLFEKIWLAARLAVGNVAPPNVHYWVNSGRHLLNSSSSGFDPQQISRSGCLFFRTARECSITTQCLRSPAGRIESCRRAASG